MAIGAGFIRSKTWPACVCGLLHLERIHMVHMGGNYELRQCVDIRWKLVGHTAKSIVLQWQCVLVRNHCLPYKMLVVIAVIRFVRAATTTMVADGCTLIRSAGEYPVINCPRRWATEKFS